MKKVLFIGDIHGRSDWEQMVTQSLPKFYHIVFLGDYVDSFKEHPAYILFNLKKILGYKKKYPDRITLLLGNHDYAYIDRHIQTSGYNFEHAHLYEEFFRQNYEYFQVAWGYRNFITNKYTLATHAGLTIRYYNNYIKTLLDDPGSYLNKLLGNKKNPELHEILNFMRDDKILWKVGAERGGMGTPGPLWADLRELLEEPYPGINQVFGHTASDTVTVEIKNGDLLVKVDGNLKGKTANIILTL